LFAVKCHDKPNGNAPFLRLLLLLFLYCLDAHGSNKVETPDVNRSETATQ